jgi:hypothetical protein
MRYGKIVNLNKGHHHEKQKAGIANSPPKAIIATTTEKTFLNGLYYFFYFSRFFRLFSHALCDDLHVHLRVIPQNT